MVGIKDRTIEDKCKICFFIHGFPLNNLVIRFVVRFILRRFIHRCIYPVILTIVGNDLCDGFIGQFNNEIFWQQRLVNCDSNGKTF